MIADRTGIIKVTAIAGSIFLNFLVEFIKLKGMIAQPKEEYHHVLCRSGSD